MTKKTYFINGKLVDGEAMQLAEASLRLQHGGVDTTALASALDECRDRCIRIFVAGAVTHVGKTTVCLSILAACRKAGIAAAELAYIKPATQCEAPDLLARWCEAEGIEHVSGECAPLVFRTGFTRSFLAGEQGTSADWLKSIKERVDKLASARRLVIIDGVGFPSVGSIVGVDNADVAQATNAPVLLVCKSGVGAAVDSFNLNCSYFTSKGVHVLGAVFNFGDLQGFNSWDKCAENIELWFEQKSKSARFYGVVPQAPPLAGLRERISKTANDELQRFALLNARHFASHVRLASLISDAVANLKTSKPSQCAIE